MINFVLIITSYAYVRIGYPLQYESCTWCPTRWVLGNDDDEWWWWWLGNDDDADTKMSHTVLAIELLDFHWKTLVHSRLVY